METVSVRPVVTRRDMDMFIALPWLLYKNDPYWVPPLKKHLRRNLDPARHPFWQHARRQLFLAERSGSCVGRICAHVDFTYNTYWNERAGCFGFFESENNPATARILFDTAINWLRKQGMTTIHGPMNPSSTTEFGFLISAASQPPAFLMPYNPPWYPELAVQNGFAVIKHLLAYEKDCKNSPTPDSVYRIASRLKKNPRYAVRPVSKKQFAADVRIITNLYNECWGGHWAYSPVSYEEMLHDFKAMKFYLDEKLTVLAFYDDQPVGMVINMPDLNEVFKLANGTLNLKGLLKILWFRTRFSRTRTLLLGFKKRFHKMGLPALAYCEMEPAIRRLFYAMEASWVHDDDHDVIDLLEGLGFVVSNRYAVVERSLFRL